MAEPQTYADAEVFDPAHGLVYGPGSAYSGQAPTAEQYKYAYDSALTRDKRAPEGSAVNPTYDTPDATGKGLYHVNPQGQLVDEHPQVNLAPGKSVMSDADVFGTHTDPNFDPSKTYDTRPTDQVLGAKEGTYTVGKNLADALSMRLPGMKANPAAGVMYLPQIATDVASAIMRRGLDAEGKTARPGQIGKVAAEVGLTLPLAFTGEGAPLLTGALQGDLTSDSADPMTRLRDIGVGAVGGKLGDLALSGVTSTIAPKVGPGASWAADNGIRLTPGMIAGDSGGIPGKVLKGIESSAAKGTIAGPMVSRAQRQTIEDTNLAGLNNALGGIGLSLPADLKAGTAAVDKAHDLFGKAYDDLAPKLTVTRDPAFDQRIGELAEAGSQLDGSLAGRYQNFVDKVTSAFDQNGQMPGTDMRRLDSVLGQQQRRFAKSDDPFHQEYGDAISDLQDTLRDATERTNPQHAGRLAALNSGYAQLVRLDKAAVLAKQTDGVWTPDQLMQAVTSRGMDNSVRQTSSARGTALLQDWAKKAKEVVPNQMPGKGNIWTHLPELAVTYGVGHEAGLPAVGGMLVGEGGLAALYTKPMQSALRATMTQRPAGAQTVADILKRLAPLTSTAGVAGAENYALPALQPLMNGNRP